MLALEAVFSLTESDCLKVNTEAFQKILGHPTTDEAEPSEIESEGAAAGSPQSLLISGDFLAAIQIPLIISCKSTTIEIII